MIFYICLYTKLYTRFLLTHILNAKFRLHHHHVLRLNSRFFTLTMFSTYSKFSTPFFTMRIRKSLIFASTHFLKISGSTPQTLNYYNHYSPLTIYKSNFMRELLTVGTLSFIIASQPNNNNNKNKYHQKK